MTQLSTTPRRASDPASTITADVAPDGATPGRATPLSLASLPAMAADRLALHNALHVARRPLEFDWHDRKATLRLLPEDTAIESAWSITLDLGGEPLTLSGSAAALDRLGQHPDRRRDLREVDRELAAMWLEVVWLEWLEPLEHRLGIDIQLRPAMSATMESPARICIAFELEGESHPLALDLPVATAERLLPTLDSAFPAQRVPADGVTATLRIESGAQTLTLGQWRNLRAGDVVMLDGATADSVRLNLADRFGCRARLGDTGLRADGPLAASSLDRAPSSPCEASNRPYDAQNRPCEESAMSEPPVDKSTSPERSGTAQESSAPTPEVPDVDSSHPSPLDSVDRNLDDLPVQLTCELGRLELSLGELRQLGEGSVLPLERHPERAVDLIVNGRRMGRGRLVAIGDAIGVQVERLALDDGRAGDD
ncbi:type III secretion system cytoplasmic ring protein SctQ [Salinicola lusitanus]|uniref:Type III secretion system cytoplasmic ring protein SctQ n=1 Tax=Salinicola lusitanus TaxID=1949085 RepID=A0ABZ3CY14_9GAMM